MKKSICIEKLFVELPFYDRFAAVRNAGFDYIEFGSWEQHDLNKIADLLEENNLKLCIISGDKNYNMIDPYHYNEFIDYLGRSCEVAKKLHCENLCMHSNALAEEGRMITDGNDLSERMKIASATKSLLGAAKIAEEQGIMLQLEPVCHYSKPGYWMTTSDSAADIIRVVGSPNLKLLYDVYHMQHDEGNMSMNLRKNADILGYVHVGDVPYRHEPGTGEINWDYLKKLIIDELKFDGIWAFELSPLTTMEECLKVLHAF